MVISLDFTAHALPLFRDDQPKSLKRKREKERANPVLSRKPEAPIPGKGVFLPCGIVWLLPHTGTADCSTIIYYSILNLCITAN